MPPENFYISCAHRSWLCSAETGSLLDDVLPPGNIDSSMCAYLPQLLNINSALEYIRYECWGNQPWHIVYIAPICFDSHSFDACLDLGDRRTTIQSEG